MRRPARAQQRGSLPALLLASRQRRVPIDLPALRRIAARAVPHCLAEAAPGAPLERLRLIQAVILSDAAMSSVHGRFLADPSPTDVIAFDHGEILLGAGCIAEQSTRFGHSITNEAAVCLIHGLLHLAGHEDATAAGARRMARLQQRIAAACR